MIWRPRAPVERKIKLCLQYLNCHPGADKSLTGWCRPRSSCRRAQGHHWLLCQAWHQGRDLRVRARFEPAVLMLAESNGSHCMYYRILFWNPSDNTGPQGLFPRVVLDTLWNHWFLSVVLEASQKTLVPNDGLGRRPKTIVSNSCFSRFRLRFYFRVRFRFQRRDVEPRRNMLTGLRNLLLMASVISFKRPP